MEEIGPLSQNNWGLQFTAIFGLIEVIMIINGPNVQINNHN